LGQQDMDCFFKCLEKGTSHGMLSDEIVIPLLVLSDRFQTRWLFEACQAYIIKNLDLNTVMDLLRNVVIPYKFSGLLHACTHFLLQLNLSSEQIQEIKKIAIKEGLLFLSILFSDLGQFCEFSTDFNEMSFSLTQNRFVSLQKSFEEIKSIEPSKWN